MPSHGTRRLMGLRRRTSHCRQSPTRSSARLSALRRRAPPDAARRRDDGRRPLVVREPPAPPLQPTPLMACDPATPPEILWRIARDEPSLRRWIVANPQADAALLEFISQAGGPYVRESLQILLDSMERRDAR